MPADLDQLLRDVAPDPDPLDVDALWAAGRRRRLLRRLATASTALAAMAVVGIGAASLAGGQGASRVEIEPVAPPDDPAEVEEPVDEPEAPADDTGQEEPAATEPATDEDDATDDSEPAIADEPATTPPASPEPDPAAVAEPCAPHEGREAEAFVAVSAPVEGQHVSGAIELVGCSNVYEATVRYRLTDGSGSVLADSFTTATCGTGCVGEFRETIELTATGELVLVVFWEDANDGSERDTVEITLQGG